MMLCSQGVRALPYQNGLRCGGITKNNCLYLIIESDDAWSGKLHFDWPRNEYKIATIDWARIVQMPPWFVVRPKRKYRVTIGQKQPQIIPGKKLIKGLSISLAAHQIRKFLVEQVK